MKYFIILIFTILSFHTTTAQSFGGGVSPYGLSWINFRYSDIKDYENNNSFHSRLSYDRFYNGHIFVETPKSDGLSFMLEGYYAQAQLVSYTKSTNANVVPNNYKLMRVQSAHIYLGKHINHTKRLQFPIYLGAGATMIKTAPISYLALTLSGKAKIEFYILNKVALYAGVAYDAGISSFGAGKTGNPDPNFNLAVRYHAAHADTGLTFNF